MVIIEMSMNDICPNFFISIFSSLLKTRAQCALVIDYNFIYSPEPLELALALALELDEESTPGSFVKKTSYNVQICTP